MLSLTKLELKLYQDAAVCYFVGKVRDNCHYIGKYGSTSHIICNSKFNVPNEIPIFLHNGSNYVINLLLKN